MDDDALERVEQLASLEVSAVIVQGVLATLPPDQRDAVVARVIEEQDYEDIGHDAHVSEGAIRQRVAGLATLRHRLGGLPMTDFLQQLGADLDKGGRGGARLGDAVPGSSAGRSPCVPSWRPSRACCC